MDERNDMAAGMATLLKVKFLGQPQTSNKKVDLWRTPT
jgi:hypothetical protein